MLTVRLATGTALQASVPNTGQAGYRQGTPVSVRLPPEAIRPLPAGPPPG